MHAAMDERHQAMIPEAEKVASLLASENVGIINRVGLDSMMGSKTLHTIFCPS